MHELVGRIVELFEFVAELQQCVAVRLFEVVKLLEVVEMSSAVEQTTLAEEESSHEQRAPVVEVALNRLKMSEVIQN